MPMYFNAKITKTSLEETKEKKTPSVCVWLELAPGKDGFLPVGVEPKQYAHLWLTDKTIERTRQTLRDLGFQGKDLLELHYSNPLEGAECNVTCEFEEYQGERRFRVLWLNTKREVRDIGDGRQFAAFNKHFADEANAPANPANAEPAANNVSQPDSGLPF